MDNRYQKILLTLLLAFVLNATAWAFAIANNSINYSRVVTKNNLFSPYKPTNYFLNSEFQSFIQRFTAIQKGRLNTFDVNNLILKPIDNIRIFPNPVSTQINISFTLSKNNQVVIKILDVLGNEILTLLNQKMEAGEQSNSFILNSKIPTGFYFVRIVTGNDAVIKRISVL